MDDSKSESANVKGKKYSLLDSVAARFQQQHEERQRRIEKFENQRYLERIHSQHLKERVVNHSELYEARIVVNEWTKKHDSQALKKGRRILKAKRMSETDKYPVANRPSSSFPTPYSRSSTVSSSSEMSRSNRTSGGSSHVPIITHKAMDSNDDSVIILDDSLQDNSITCQETSNTENEELRCNVVNCWTKFTNFEKLLRHMYSFAHSPCNPLASYPDIDVNESIIGFACPKCWSIFQTKQFCIEHMISEKHSTYLTALEVVGILCGECLSILPTTREYTQHIETTKHGNLSYPFPEDVLKGGKFSSYIHITKAMAMHFYKMCQEAKFEVRCTDCGVLMQTYRELRLHNAETDQQHIISSSAEQTQVDIFLHYLCYGFCCGTCGSLCHAPESADSQHTCCTRCNVTGPLINLQCTTFKQFVRTCCIMCENEWNQNHGENCISNSVKAKKGEKNESIVQLCMFGEPSSSSEPVHVSGKNGDTDVMIVETNQPDKQDTDVMIVETNQPDKQVCSYQREVITSNSLIDTAHLCEMENIVFLDLDNWGGFFRKLPEPLKDKTFVWGFYGGSTVWKEPVGCRSYLYQKDNHRFYLHQKCGNRKDAADFAICLKVGQMDEKLPKTVAFTILSGDRGFHEIEKQMKNSERRAVVVDPHAAQGMGDWVLYAMINSVGDT